MKVKELVGILSQEDADSVVSIGFGEELVEVHETSVWNGDKRHFILELTASVGISRSEEHDDSRD